MADESKMSGEIEEIDIDEYQVIDDIGSDDEKTETPRGAEIAPETSEKADNARKQAGSKLWRRRFPTKEHPVPCDVCKKLFTRADALKAHMGTHTGEKPFACPTCGNTYMKARYLREHKRVHTGVKPFSCDQCSRAFTRSSDLTMHRREHSGEKRYKCEACAKCYLKSRYLKDHKKSCLKWQEMAAEAASKEKGEVKETLVKNNDRMEVAAN